VDDTGTRTRFPRHSLRVTRDVSPTIMYPILFIIGGFVVVLGTGDERKGYRLFYREKAFCIVIIKQGILFLKLSDTREW
jgi:hypothetical protein